MSLPTLSNLVNEYPKSMKLVKLARLHRFLKQDQLQLVPLFSPNFLQVLLALLNKLVNLFSENTTMKTNKKYAFAALLMQAQAKLPNSFKFFLSKKGGIT